MEKIIRFGNPDEAKISTSFSERFNLTVRMQNRCMTRLTNAHSKKTAHHAAMMSLTTAYDNFCRKHATLKGHTPAMAAGLTDRVWTLKEVISVIRNHAVRRLTAHWYGAYLLVIRSSHRITPGCRLTGAQPGFSHFLTFPRPAPKRSLAAAVFPNAPLNQHAALTCAIIQPCEKWEQSNPRTDAN